MRLIKTNLHKEQEGSSLVIFALLLVVMTGIAGLVIDMGLFYNTRSHLKKTANAAVLSGAQELLNGDDSVNEVVDEVLRAHGEEGSVAEKQINTAENNKLKVVLQKDVPTRFLKLFKIDTLRAKESSSAGLLPMGRAEGAVPLGIDESIPLEYMKEYSLKVDSGDSEYGNFGILALSGPGARLYENDLMYGFENEIKVGDVIETQTGNVEGKTRNAINYRINSCPYPEGDLSHRDNPRIMLVLVYRPYEIDMNQLKAVKITGFAYFYIKSPVDIHDSSITGYFIKRTGTGFGDESIAGTGAYAIRLTE